MLSSNTPKDSLPFSVKINGVILNKSFSIPSVHIRQMGFNSFIARFSVLVTAQDVLDNAISYAKGYAEIFAGRDGDLYPVFMGPIDSARLETKDDWFMYTFSCHGEGMLVAAQKSPEKPVIGESVLAMDFEERDDVIYGFVTIPGSISVWMNEPIDLTDVPPVSQVVDAAWITHTIENGNWTTSVYIGQPFESSRIEYKTAGGGSIVLDDADNSIVIKDASGNGFSLINGALKLAAQQDVSISGLNISHTAEGDMNINGPTGIKITANGEISLRGSKILLN